MESYPYQIVGTGEKEESLFFMLDSFLRSRIDLGVETTDDEEVNVYLAGLLHKFFDKSFPSEFVSRYESDLLKMAEACENLEALYRLYKVNGDYALMAVSVFNPSTDSRKPIDENDFIERGKLYYRWAADYHIRSKRTRTGVSDVMTRLSERFEDYREILSHTRTEYFNLLRRFSTGEMFHLSRVAQEMPFFKTYEEGLDVFLDAYNEWSENKSEVLRERVNRIGNILSEKDSNFKFDGLQ